MLDAGQREKASRIKVVDSFVNLIDLILFINSVNNDLFNFCVFFNSESLDNPFRPEGQLAKEADEFVKQLKIKEEQKVQEIIQTSLNNSINTTSAASPSKSINIELSGVNVSVSNANTPAKHNTNNNVSSPTKSPATNNVNSPSSPKNTNATPSKPAAAQDNNSSKKDDKKKKKSSDDKTKPKCGCTIS